MNCQSVKSWVIAIQGFEVTVAGRTYFAFSDYTELMFKVVMMMMMMIMMMIMMMCKVVSHCGRTRPGQGWAHDVTVRQGAILNSEIQEV